MATEKNILGRIIHKHDIEANWDKATGFIPKQGEVIVYDIDENFHFERIKIGDGVTAVTNLPFYLYEEIENVLIDIAYLAQESLKASCVNDILTLSKGIILPE